MRIGIYARINRSCINIASYKCGIVQAANAQNMLSYLNLCITWLEVQRVTSTFPACKMTKADGISCG